MQQQQVERQNEQDAVYIQTKRQNDIRQSEQEAVANASDATKPAASTKVGAKIETDQQRNMLAQDKQVTFTTDTDTLTVSTGAQHTRDEVDAAEKATDDKVSVMTADDYATAHQVTGADTETEITKAHSEAGEMDADTATTFRNERFRTPTEDAQPHPAGNTAACTLDYSELVGIMKQMQKGTNAQAAHKQSEKPENKPSELTTKLDDVTHLMEEKQFNFTYSNNQNSRRWFATFPCLNPHIGGPKTKRCVFFHRKPGKECCSRNSRM